MSNSRNITAEKFNAKGNTVGTMNININEIGPVTYIVIENANGQGNSMRLCVKTGAWRAAVLGKQSNEDKMLDLFEEVVDQVICTSKGYERNKAAMEAYREYRYIRDQHKDGSIVLNKEQKERLKELGKKLLKEGLDIDEDAAPQAL